MKLVVAVVVVVLLVVMLGLMNNSGVGTIQLKDGYSLELPPCEECRKGVPAFVVLRGPSGERLTTINIYNGNSSQGREWPRNIPYGVKYDAIVNIGERQTELADAYRRRAS